MANRYINPKPQYLDPVTGAPILNGELNFYENDTLVRKNTYADVNLTVLNANPVPLNANGTVPNIFYNGTARVILTYGAGQVFDLGSVGDSGSGAAFDVWNSVVEYEDGAYVVGSDGLIYKSLQNNNTGNDPTSSPTFWEHVAFLRTWNANITYALGDGGVVGSDGQIYASLQAANLNNDPVSSPAWWAINNPFDQDLNTTDPVQFDKVDVQGGTRLAAYNGYNLNVTWNNAGDTFFGHFMDIVNTASAASSRLVRYDVSSVVKFDIDLTGKIVNNAGIQLGGTGAANLLDDYEEGTWTPALQGSTGSAGVAAYTSSGTYTKVGRKVKITARIDITNVGSWTGNFQISGIPFTAGSSGADFHGVCRMAFTTIIGAWIDSRIASGGAIVDLVEMNSGAQITVLPITSLQAGGNSAIIIEMEYFV